MSVPDLEPDARRRNRYAQVQTVSRGLDLDGAWSALRSRRTSRSIRPTTASARHEYSPYLDQGFPDRVYFGDTHLHTSYSTDAGMVGNRLGPEEAYRFARGEEVISSTGLRARLQRPLDFLVVSDHAENLGLAPMIEESNPDLLRTEVRPAGARPREERQRSGGLRGLDRAHERAGRPAEGQRGGHADHVGAVETEAAEKYNQPGKFTRHHRLRVDLDAGWQQPASQRHLPRRQGARPTRSSPSRSTTASIPRICGPGWPTTKRRPRGSVLAIPHGGNLSLGLMFDDVTLTTRKPLDRDYARRRMRWEPLYEVTQMKGDGEAHLALSAQRRIHRLRDLGPRQLRFGCPHARHAAARIRPRGAEARARNMSRISGLTRSSSAWWVRPTLTRPCRQRRKTTSSARSCRWSRPPGQDRFDEVVAGRFSGEDPKRKSYAWQTSASGLAAVWATDNTREALWDAMARKEVYATIGDATAGARVRRLRLRRRRRAAARLRQVRLPERACLWEATFPRLPPAKSPKLLIRALRDADGANLDRVQVVKGWLDAQGRTCRRRSTTSSGPAIARQARTASCRPSATP